MKLLILAAGRGTRISRHINDVPKCTVELPVMNKPLIFRTIKQFKSRGVTDITIATGFKSEVIEGIVGELDVKVVRNPFYDVTNSIASVWFCRNELDGDCILMNGDVFLEDSLVDLIIEEKSPRVLYCDSTRIEDADYRFNYSNGVLNKFGKDLDVSETTGEYVGVAKISSGFIDTFKAKLVSMVQEQSHGKWWEDVLYEMVGKRDIFVRDISGKFWAEIDYIEDYQRIRDWVSENG